MTGDWDNYAKSHGAEEKAMADTRYVTSVGCTWHGPIQEVSTHARLRDLNGWPRQSTRGDDLPCCPHCGSMLTECASRAEFDAGAHRFANSQMRGEERAYLAWLQSLHDSGTCHPLKDWDWRADFEAWKAAHV